MFRCKAGIRSSLHLQVTRKLHFRSDRDCQPDLILLIRAEDLILAVLLKFQSFRNLQTGQFMILHALPGKRERYRAAVCRSHRVERTVHIAFHGQHRNDGASGYIDLNAGHIQLKHIIHFGDIVIKLLEVLYAAAIVGERQRRGLSFHLRFFDGELAAVEKLVSVSRCRKRKTRIRRQLHIEGACQAAQGDRFKLKLLLLLGRLISVGILLTGDLFLDLFYVQERRIRQGRAVLRHIDRIMLGGEGVAFGRGLHLQVAREFHFRSGCNGQPDIALGSAAKDRILAILLKIQSFRNLRALQLMILRSLPSESERDGMAVECGKGVEVTFHLTPHRQAGGEDSAVGSNFYIGDIQFQNVIHSGDVVIKLLEVLNAGSIVGKCQGHLLAVFSRIGNAELASVLQLEGSLADIQSFIRIQRDGKAAPEIAQGDRLELKLFLLYCGFIGIIFLFAGDLLLDLCHVQERRVGQVCTGLRDIYLIVLCGKRIAKSGCLHLKVAGKFHFRSDRYGQLDGLCAGFEHSIGAIPAAFCVLGARRCQRLILHAFPVKGERNLPAFIIRRCEEVTGDLSVHGQRHRQHLRIGRHLHLIHGQHQHTRKIFNVIEHRFKVFRVGRVFQGQGRGLSVDHRIAVDLETGSRVDKCKLSFADIQAFLGRQLNIETAVHTAQADLRQGRILDGAVSVPDLLHLFLNCCNIQQRRIGKDISRLNRKDLIILSRVSGIGGFLHLQVAFKFSFRRNDHRHHNGIRRFLAKHCILAVRSDLDLGSCRRSPGHLVILLACPLKVKRHLMPVKRRIRMEASCHGACQGSRSGSGSCLDAGDIHDQQIRHRGDILFQRCKVFNRSFIIGAFQNQLIRGLRFNAQLKFASADQLDRRFREIQCRICAQLYVKHGGKIADRNLISHRTAALIIGPDLCDQFLNACDIEYRRIIQGRVRFRSEYLIMLGSERSASALAHLRIARQLHFRKHLDRQLDIAGGIFPKNQVGSVRILVLGSLPGKAERNTAAVH